MSQTDARLMLAQFHSGVGAHGVRPYQWHLCVEMSGPTDRFNVATIFYIRGSDAAGYQFEMKEGVRYKTSSAYRGAIYLGPIRRRHLPDLPNLLAGVDIERGSFASQVWAYRAIRRLLGYKILHHELFAFEYYAQSLAHAEAAWERGDD
ncbi:hypothetical protein OH77DRAFT_1421636 [Trametes cingulata]|nr:hypothetical protein OH77DRAFT_1421636 [Trametes cingulata]